MTYQEYTNEASELLNEAKCAFYVYCEFDLDNGKEFDKSVFGGYCFESTEEPTVDCVQIVEDCREHKKIVGRNPLYCDLVEIYGEETFQRYAIDWNHDIATRYEALINKVINSGNYELASRILSAICTSPVNVNNKFKLSENTERLGLQESFYDDFVFQSIYVPEN